MPTSNTMDSLPLRWYCELGLPKKRDNARRVIQDAIPTRIRINSTAIEMLSFISGKQLMRIQRRTLLPTLLELLKDGTSGPIDSGPLSQVDVLAAILGVIQFALQAGGRWQFVRIPETEDKSPDIFAIPSQGEAWYIELKGVAPLSSEVIYGADLDTCKRIMRQRLEGVEQLNAPTVKVPRGAPTVKMILRNPPRFKNNGGKALSIIVLPDGALANRNDMPIRSKRPESGGTRCPQEMRCVDFCLSGAHANYPAGLVGLLWLEPNRQFTKIEQQPPSDKGVLKVLAAVQTLNLALWADSNSVADEALGALAKRLTRACLAQVMDKSSAASILLRCLVATRHLTSQAMRANVLDDFRDKNKKQSSLVRGEIRKTLAGEAMLGLSNPRAVHDIQEMHSLTIQTASPLEIRVELPGYQGAGSFGHGSLRLVPRLRMIDSALFEEYPPSFLLNKSNQALRSGLLQHVLQEAYDPDTIFSEVIIESFDKENSPKKNWIIGYEWSEVLASSTNHRYPTISVADLIPQNYGRHLPSAWCSFDGRILIRR